MQLAGQQHCLGRPVYSGGSTLLPAHACCVCRQPDVHAAATAEACSTAAQCWVLRCSQRAPHGAVGIRGDTADVILKHTSGSHPHPHLSRKLATRSAAGRVRPAQGCALAQGDGAQRGGARREAGHAHR